VTAHAVRGAANRFVERLDVGPAPIDTVAVAKTIGLPITREPLATEITGALVTTPCGPALVLNARQPANRQRLLVAHMIGHLQLGHRFQSTVHVEGRFEAYRGERRYTAAERLEFEANVFAGTLLMPTRLLRQALTMVAHERLGDDDIQRLAQQFGVSVQGMTLRLSGAGLL
jgi:Zn-dependent peptidase ImmA (M78 family)